MRGFLLLTVIFLSVIGHAEAPSQIKLTDREMREDAEWLKGLGIQPPEGYLLRTPFAEPLSKQSFVVPMSWYKEPLKKQVSASSLLEDLPLIKIAMERAYSGYETAAKRGWDFEKWFRDWESYLISQGRKVLTVEEAFAPLVKLKKFQPDNHMGAIVDSQEVYGRVFSYNATLDHAPKSSCELLKNEKGEEFKLVPETPSHQPKLALLPNSNGKLEKTYYLTYPSVYGEVSKVSCGGEWISLKNFWQNSIAPTNKVNKVLKLALTETDQASYRWVDKEILYIRFPTFIYANRDSYLQLEKDIQKINVQDAKVIIMDHRTNGGGYGFGYPIYDYLTKGLFSKTKEQNWQRKHSCLSYTGSGMWGQIQWMLAMNNEIETLPKEDLAEYQKHLDGLMSKEECSVSIEKHQGEFFYTQRSFEPKKSEPIFMFLTDNGCGSTCEGVQFGWSQFKNAIIVGSNTFGVAQFIGGNFFVFPNTKITYRFSSGLSDVYGDDRPYDGYGLDADVILPNEEMQEPEFIIELARSLRRKVLQDGI